MQDNLKLDICRYIGNRKDRFYFFKNRIFRFQYFYRKNSINNKRSIKGIFYHFIYSRFLSIKYGSMMESSAEIGPGLKLLSCLLIIINGNSKIGKNCTISQGVTIGISNRGKRKGCPTLGNNVWIGPYAVIVGNITIGNNVWIAPNSYINIDVPDNSRVIGNPAQIISDENAVKDYIINPIE